MALFNRLPFQAKILLSFGLIIILTIGFGYFFVSRAIGQAFENFSLRNARGQASEFLHLLGNYYERTGSWHGLGQLLSHERSERFGRQPPFVLTDHEGMVIIAPDDNWVGQKLSARELDSGLPIVAAGQTVGTLLVSPRMRWKSPLEQEFFQSVSSALWLAGLAAGGIALLLGFGLLRQITAPLRTLNTAAKQIAQGQLSQRVLVRNHDELGRLAQSFNEMAASLEKAEQTKALIEAHGGRIWAGNARSGEACFHFTLPQRTVAF